MKKVSIIIGLSLMGFCAIGQIKEKPGKKQEKVFVVPFTKNGYNSLMRQADSALNNLNESNLTMKEAKPIIGFINAVKYLFNENMRRQLLDTTKLKTNK